MVVGTRVMWLDRLDGTLVDFFDLDFFDEDTLMLFEEDALSRHVELFFVDILMAFDEDTASEREVPATSTGDGSMGLAKEVPG